MALNDFLGIDSPAESGFVIIPSRDPEHATGKGGDPATSDYRQTPSPNVPPTVERHFNRGDAEVPSGGKGMAPSEDVFSDALNKNQ